MAEQKNNPQKSGRTAASRMDAISGRDSGMNPRFSITLQ
jgi:hypothetical protein